MQPIDTGKRLRALASKITGAVPKYLLIDTKTADGVSHPCPLKLIVESICEIADKAEGWYSAENKTLSRAKRAYSIAKAIYDENPNERNTKLYELLRMILQSLVKYEETNEEMQRVVTTLEDGKVVSRLADAPKFNVAQHVRSYGQTRNFGNDRRGRGDAFGRGVEIDLLPGVTGV